MTDAYEFLVSHTDPKNPDTDGDGLLDGWEVLWGTDPRANSPLQAGQRSNYSYEPTAWLNGITGLRSGSVNSDYEGNIQQSAQ